MRPFDGALVERRLTNRARSCAGVQEDIVTRALKRQQSHQDFETRASESCLLTDNAKAI
jgi:hypothetical protein